MKAKEYGAKITQKGQITLLRKANNCKQKKNLYETSFGDYDFQKDAHSDPELSELYPVGIEGWKFEDEK